MYVPSSTRVGEQGDDGTCRRDPSEANRRLSEPVAARVHPRLSGWCAVAIVTAATACDPSVITEHRQVRLSSNLSTQEFLSGDPALVGAQVCLRYEGYRTSEGDETAYTESDDSELRACYRESLRGPARFADDGCFSLDHPGEIAWIIERQPCAIDAAFEDDLLRIDVVTLDDVRGAFSEAVPLRPVYLEMFAIEDPASEQPGVVAEPGEPLWVIEDIVDSVSARVVTTGAPPREVGVTQWSVRGMAIAGAPTFAPEDAPSSTLGFEARAGDAFHVAIDVPAGELDVGEVRVVAREDVASLDLFPNASYILEPRALLGAGARAIARDAEGHVLRGPPVVWSVLAGEVDLSRHDFDEDGAPDPGEYANISDPCASARRGEHRSATLQGEIDAFRESVDVAWTCHEGQADGCGCRSGPGSCAPGLLVLIFAWRRRLARSSCHP